MSAGVAALVTLAGRLVEASVAGGVLALVVWGACRVFPAIPPALRCWLWWGVALKMLLGLVPLPPLRVPVLPPPAASVEAPREEGGDEARPYSGAEGVELVPPAGDLARRAAEPAIAGVATTDSAFPWPFALMTLWLAGVAVELARGAVALRRARRVARAATAPGDPDMLATFDALRRRLGVPPAALRLSTQVATPQVIGVARPVVLLPAGMPDRLAGDELAMALGHELVHVRRADLLFGLVPALARCAFFFHPLVRLAVREHAQAREEACDAAVVAGLAPSPRAYGRLLLELALGCGAPLRAAAAVVNHRTLQRRLRMLLHPTRTWRPAWTWSLVLAGLGLLIPWRLTARADVALPGEERPIPAVSEAAPMPDGGDVPSDDLPAPHPVASTTPERMASMSEEPPLPPPAKKPTRDRWDLSIVYFSSDHETTIGSSEDIERARRYRRGSEPTLWFRRGGEEWVIDDRELLAQVDALWEPMRELGAQQAELGSRQAELGTQQAELGSQQAALGQQQAALASRQAQVASQMARLAAEAARFNVRRYRASDDEQAALDEQQRELDRQRRQMEEGIHQLSRQQAALGEQQAALGGQQGVLGARQGDLGDQQATLGELQRRTSENVERQLERLLDEAIRNGKARRVD